MIIKVALPKISRSKTERMSDFFVKAPIAGMLAALYPIIVQAQAKSNQEEIIAAFDPIIDLARGVSYPLAFLMVVGGALCIIIGQRSRGLGIIKWAAIGYISVQFAPGFMRLLAQVGTAIASR